MKAFSMLLLTLLPTSAAAHNGDHTPFDLSAFFEHLMEPDHLVMIGLAVLAAYFAFKRNKVSRCSIAVKKDRDHEPR
jgi:hydrogenase/urease accessory protein HupE